MKEIDDKLNEFMTLVLTDDDLFKFKHLPASEKTCQYYAIHFSILSTLIEQTWFKEFAPHLQTLICAKFDKLYANAFLNSVFTY